jgi:uncharacterized protein (DUF697 family)
MHNIDRTVNEANYEYNEMEFNPETYEYNGELGQEAGGSYEMENEFLNELNEMNGEYSGEVNGEYANEYSGEFGYETNEMNEMNQEVMETELATELLSVSNEAELDQFLGKLIKKAAGAVKSFAKSSAGRALGGILKSAAKAALPIVGGALGGLVGPAGAALGGKLGSMASNLFELELEGLSNEDKEFELSRAYVRFANDAVRRAIRNPRFRTYPRQAVRNAVIVSAKRWAPGLLRRRLVRNPYYGRTTQYSNPGYAYRNQNVSSYGNQQGSGTWYRQGNQIIINL